MTKRLNLTERRNEKLAQKVKFGLSVHNEVRKEMT